MADMRSHLSQWITVSPVGEPLYGDLNSGRAPYHDLQNEALFHRMLGNYLKQAHKLGLANPQFEQDVKWIGYYKKL